MIKKPYGQEKLTAFFENAVKNDTLGHAYIIEGDEGMGKKTLAGYFAAVSVCEKGTGCGECSQCKQTAAGTNPDIISISAEGKASVGVDKIRVLADALSLRTFHGGKRVVIMEDADLLTVQAQNALLKIIEEPPADTVFLLLCRRSSMMLRTIISRTQVLKLAPLSLEVLKRIIPSCSEFEYAYCGGNPGKLIKISSDADFKQFREDALNVLYRFFTSGEDALYETVDFFELNKDRKDDLINIMTLIIRDVMYKKMSLSKFIINRDKPEIIDGISKATTLYTVVKAIHTVLDSEGSMGKYGNYNLAVQAMLLKVWNSKAMVFKKTQEET